MGIFYFLVLSDGLFLAFGEIPYTIGIRKIDWALWWSRSWLWGINSLRLDFSWSRYW
jgi:hypothetical protein